MTVFRSKNAHLNGSAPLLLTAYGAYGECLDEDFRLERLPLLRRGWTLAFAHVRGGGEQGRRCAPGFEVCQHVCTMPHAFAAN